MYGNHIQCTTKIKTTKISSGASAGISAKICTHENLCTVKELFLHT